MSARTSVRHQGSEDGNELAELRDRDDGGGREGSPRFPGRAAGLALGAALALVASGCARGPSPEEVKQAVTERLRANEYVRNVCSVQSVTELASTKIDGGAWRKDLKVEIVVTAAPEPRLTAFTVGACGCANVGCVGTKRESYTIRKTTEGWTIVDVKTLP